MDLGLPGLSGLDGIRLLRAADPSVQLVALTVFEDDDRVFEALCAGASGYLLKKTPPAPTSMNRSGTSSSSMSAVNPRSMTASVGSAGLT